MTETQHIEWKSFWRDEYLKWLCGFANADGGTLVIGKNDRGEVVGVANAQKLLVDIPNTVRDALGIIVDVNLRTTRSCSGIRGTCPLAGQLRGRSKNTWSEPASCDCGKGPDVGPHLRPDTSPFKNRSV